MRKQLFAVLELERLEKLVLPNMLLGPSPFSYLNEAASEPPSLVGPQNFSQGRHQTHVHSSPLLDAGQPPPSSKFVRSDVIAHSDGQTVNSTISTQNSIFFSATDDLRDPLNSDFFDIDLLVASKGRAPSFMGRDSLGMSAAVGIASSTAADSTGPSIPPANARLSGGFITNSAAAIPVLSNPVPSANLLLPPANSAPAILAGPHKGGPVAPPSGPSFGSSPNGATGGLDLVTPQFVPVNADNDNNSGVTFGIPATRDFNVAPMIDANTK